MTPCCWRLVPSSSLLRDASMGVLMKQSPVLYLKRATCLSVLVRLSAGFFLGGFFKLADLCQVCSHMDLSSGRAANNAYWHISFSKGFLDLQTCITSVHTLICCLGWQSVSNVSTKVGKCWQRSTKVNKGQQRSTKVGNCWHRLPNLCQSLVGTHHK
jgi:hypothetical protein